MNRPNDGITVTLTTAGTPYNLMSLVQAAQLARAATETSTWNGTSSQCQIQSDIANGAANIYFGSSGVSSTAYGYLLQTLGSRQYGPFPMNAANMEWLWVVSDTNSVKLHVEYTNI